MTIQQIQILRKTKGHFSIEIHNAQYEIANQLTMASHRNHKNG